MILHALNESLEIQRSYDNPQKTTTKPCIQTLKNDIFFCTHYYSRSSSDHAVEDKRRDETGFLQAGVRLHQLGVVTEEALHVHTE